MRDVEPLQAEDALPPPGQVVEGGAAHPADADHDGVEGAGAGGGHARLRAPAGPGRRRSRRRSDAAAVATAPASPEGVSSASDWGWVRTSLRTPAPAAARPAIAGPATLGPMPRRCSSSSRKQHMWTSVSAPRAKLDQSRALAGVAGEDHAPSAGVEAVGVALRDRLGVARRPRFDRPPLTTRHRSEHHVPRHHLGLRAWSLPPPLREDALPHRVLSPDARVVLVHASCAKQRLRDASRSGRTVHLQRRSGTACGPTAPARSGPGRPCGRSGGG